MCLGASQERCCSTFYTLSMLGSVLSRGTDRSGSDWACSRWLMCYLWSTKDWLLHFAERLQWSFSYNVFLFLWGAKEPQDCYTSPMWIITFCLKMGEYSHYFTLIRKMLSLLLFHCYCAMHIIFKKVPSQNANECCDFLCLGSPLCTKTDNGTIR